MDTISVIITTKNEDKNIANCLESINLGEGIRRQKKAGEGSIRYKKAVEGLKKEALCGPLKPSILIEFALVVLRRNHQQ